VVEESGKDGGIFKTFVPVLIVGPNAEECASMLEPGDVISVSGKLAYKAGLTKESGKLVVVCYGVARLVAAPVPVESAN